MAVGLPEPTHVFEIAGVRLATANASIRYQNRQDLTLIELVEASSVAAVFTQNKFRAAPVNLAEKNLAHSQPRYLIINAGNANAGTGTQGDFAALKTTQVVAEAMGVQPEQVLPFSTGVIGEQLDVDKISEQLVTLKKELSGSHWLEAAQAIMTTDTVSKAFSKKIRIQDHDIHITGIAKGSGMIQPNMATMLSYVATDLDIPQELIKSILIDCVDKSFNSITVDSDTSTNDACVFVATGCSKVQYSALSKQEQDTFLSELSWIMKMLSQAIIRDGEGATKFVTINVEGALSAQQAKSVAYSIANSPLVKTAITASDPNWGRIMAAAGKCDCDQLDLSNTNLRINSVEILNGGEISTSYTEGAGKNAMLDEEIVIDLELNLGKYNSQVWTTDLSHEYIRINAEYRS